MPLPSVVDSLEGIEESYRPLYVEVTEGELAGKFVADLDPTGHPKFTTARAESVKERKARQALEVELKAFRDLGYTPEQVAEFKAKAEAAAGGEKPDVDKLIAKRVQEALDKVKPDLDERDTLKAENRKMKLTDKVRAAFIDAGGLEEDADDEVKLTEGRFDLNEKGRVVVLDDDGDEREMSPKEWFEKVHRQKKPKVFKGTTASGSGARNGRGAGGSGSDAEIRNLPGARMVESAFAGGKTK